MHSPPHPSLPSKQAVKQEDIQIDGGDFVRSFVRLLFKNICSYDCAGRLHRMENDSRRCTLQIPAQLNSVVLFQWKPLLGLDFVCVLIESFDIFI